jgi:hypothetical protein
MTNAEVFLLISTISMTFIEDSRSDAVQCGVLADATIKCITERFGEEGLTEFSDITTKDAVARIVAELGSGL